MISGLIGAGVGQGLEELLARQLLEAQQAERERAQRAQEGLAGRRLDQDATQQAELVGLRQAEMGQRQSQFDAETEQQSIEALHKNNDKMDARLTRLQGEEDQMAAAEALQAELSALMGDQNVPDIDKRALRLRRLGVTSAPHMTDEEQDADAQREIRTRSSIAGAEEAARARNRPTPQPASMTPGQKFQATQSLRKSFQTETKAAREVGMQLQQMRAGLDAARKGDMAAGSQAVLVTFQKILDPASVVRESEYSRSSAGQSLLSRIEGAAQQLAQGGAGIPLPQLERFVALAEQFAQNQQGAAQDSTSQLNAIAQEYGIDPALVVGGGGGDREIELVRGPDGKLVPKR